jgi:RNA polymerase sigma factor (sigma-70 family)
MKDINLIRKTAWQFHRTTGIEFEELFSEACLGYTIALQSYQPGHSQLSTWATHIMKNQLISFCRKEQKYQQPLTEPNIPDDEETSWEENIPYTIHPEKQYIFKQWLYNLPNDLQLVCKMIFDAPEEFLANSPRASRGKIVKKLRERNWSWIRIWDSMRNMKNILN